VDGSFFDHGRCDIGVSSGNGLLGSRVIMNDGTGFFFRFILGLMYQPDFNISLIVLLSIPWVGGVGGGSIMFYSADRGGVSVT